MYLYMCSFLETKSVALLQRATAAKKGMSQLMTLLFLYKVSLILKDLANI